jgi:hypothetical protein
VASTDLMVNLEVHHMHIKLPMEEMDQMDLMVMVMAIMKKLVGAVVKEETEVMDIKELQEVMDRMGSRQEIVILLPIYLTVIVIAK